MSDFEFTGFEPSNTTNCWICQQPYYRYAGQWAKSGYATSELCPRCYSGLLNKVVRQKKRARTKNANATLTTTQWIEILHASEARCHYCHEYIGYMALIMEHVVPVAYGGGTTAENVVPACRQCNSKKVHEDHQKYVLYDVGIRVDSPEIAAVAYKSICAEVEWSKHHE